ncbi:DUF5337 domain-containing protein [Tropicimonas sediminicola]|uniref:Uncharacterized protein n=1 Tax=Tropicimonas sediminicola TaxID=1031541 RepID=A0A239HH22_9RHOB|nr:DUF5337 domain-containing protein [Tropicimonas sediminicola]SNS80612.1 hypothetical protein SAMN05421757_103416 [Tropicimonas sediminicola]
MTGKHDNDSAFARQGRIVALVIAAAGLLAIFAPVLVQLTGLPARYEMLFYFASLAAFFWALVAALRMWRGRSGDQG